MTEVSEFADLPERSRAIQRQLDELGLDIRVREMPESTHTAADAARALGCEVGAIASSLLFVVDGAPLLVMTSGRHRVDTEVLARELGAESVRMADAKLVREVTGQATGGVAPIGHPAPVPTVVDEALDEHEVVWAAGGTPRTIMPLTPEVLRRITGGRTIRVE